MTIDTQEAVVLEKLTTLASELNDFVSKYRNPATGFPMKRVAEVVCDIEDLLERLKKEVKIR